MGLRLARLTVTEAFQGSSADIGTAVKWGWAAALQATAAAIRSSRAARSRIGLRAGWGGVGGRLIRRV